MEFCLFSYSNLRVKMLSYAVCDILSVKVNIIIFLFLNFSTKTLNMLAGVAFEEQNIKFPKWTSLNINERLKQ